MELEVQVLLKVQFKNDLSPGLRLDFGVQQCSILGPLLFILYINDLPECLVNCSIGMYADDTVMYFPDLSPVKVMRARNCAHPCCA